MAQTGPRPWPEPSDLVDEEKPVASSAKVKVSATGSGSLIPEPHNARVEAWWWGGKCSFEIILKGGPGATGPVRPFVSPHSSAATDASAASKSSRSVQQWQPGTTRRKMEHWRFLGNEGALSRVLRLRAWLKTFGVQTNL